MSRIRSTDTSIERLVRSKLFARGLRYRKNARWLPGSPDIVFSAKRVAVFLDGDFWHGRDFSLWRQKLTPEWCQKISTNIDRDERVAVALEQTGWRVIRFWESDIIRDVEAVVDRIVAELN